MHTLDCSLPGFSVHEIFQARIVKWIAISSSRESSQPKVWAQVSHITGRFFTLTHQGSLFLTVSHKVPHEETEVQSWSDAPRPTKL